MTHNPFHLTVLCGGQSPEHDISLVSARNVVKHLDPQRYHVDVIYITREGGWERVAPDQFVAKAMSDLRAGKQTQPLWLRPGSAATPWVIAEAPHEELRVDCVFPVLHGELGEDGAPQGLLDMLGVPYVGADVLASAIGMAKHVVKPLWRAAGLPTCDWLLLRPTDQGQWSYEAACQELGSDTLFVKPSRQGSSVGVSRVTGQEGFDEALVLAFRYDDRVLIEPRVVGREIECSVLGNTTIEVASPGELCVTHDFYSYEAKYIDPEGAHLMTPADLSEKLVELVKQVALRAYQVMDCCGMARVDFFVGEHDVMLNEINTIPGFTDISMYPKNWQASGLSYSNLLDRLIALALERFSQQQCRSTEQSASTIASS